MEILLWLVPPVVVTVVAMAWVGWLGREGRGEVGREEAIRRMGAALERDAPVHPDGVRRERERSTGVAVRRTPRRVPPLSAPVQPAVDAEADEGPDAERRAS